MTERKDGGPVFPTAPSVGDINHSGDGPLWVTLGERDALGEVRSTSQHPGMSLRDYFKGQALANPALCSGEAEDWQLRHWFRTGQGNITRFEIAAKQAEEYADAMLAERNK